MILHQRSWILGAIAGLGTAWMIIEAGLPKAAPGSDVSPKRQPSAPAALADLSSVKKGDPRELYAIIEGQIAAIRRDDFPAAYQFAAEGIRSKFPVAAFRDMVQKAYPQLTRSRRVNYGQAQFAANIRASALIYVSDGEVLSPMIYAFVRENGQWKIEGVQMLQSRDPDISGPQT